MTKNEVLSKLILKDSNYRRFALAHGYTPRLVQQAVTRFAGTNNKPNGILTYKVLRDLSTFIGEPVIDGLDELIA